MTKLEESVSPRVGISSPSCPLPHPGFRDYFGLEGRGLRNRPPSQNCGIRRSPHAVQKPINIASQNANRSLSLSLTASRATKNRCRWPLALQHGSPSVNCPSDVPCPSDVHDGILALRTPRCLTPQGSAATGRSMQAARGASDEAMRPPWLRVPLISCRLQVFR
jgi:hypothetical protein